MPAVRQGRLPRPGRDCPISSACLARIYQQITAHSALVFQRTVFLPGPFRLREACSALNADRPGNSPACLVNTLWHLTASSAVCRCQAVCAAPAAHAAATALCGRHQRYPVPACAIAHQAAGQTKPRQALLTRWSSTAPCRRQKAAYQGQA